MSDRDAAIRAPKSTVRLTKSIIDTTPLPPAGKRVMIWDGEVKGFGCRFAANGAKTYVLRYRMGGREAAVRTYTIGQHGSPWTVDQARQHARQQLLLVRNGIDVVAQQQAERQEVQAGAAMREERQFSTLAEEWFEKHVLRDGLRSHRDIRGVLDRDLKPAFAGRLSLRLVNPFG